MLSSPNCLLNKYCKLVKLVSLTCILNKTLARTYRNIQGAARQRNALPQMLGYRDRYILEYIYSVTRARYKDEEKKIFKN